MIKVHHQRAAGYIRGNVRWPRGTNYFADAAFDVLTSKQKDEISNDPALVIEKVAKKDVPAAATVIERFDLVDPKAKAKPAVASSGDKGKSGQKGGKTGKGGAAGDSGKKNKAPASPPLGGSNLTEFMAQMLSDDPKQDNKDWWTTDGAPEIKHLRDQGGFDISAADERDEAWETVKALPEMAQLVKDLK